MVRLHTANPVVGNSVSSKRICAKRRMNECATKEMGKLTIAETSLAVEGCEDTLNSVDFDGTCQMDYLNRARRHLGRTWDPCFA